MSQNEYFPARQQIELPPMSKTRGAVVWARPLSGARGVEKCLHLYVIEIMTLSALSRLYPKPHLFAPKEISVNTKNDKTKGKLFKFFFFFIVIFFSRKTARLSITVRIWYGPGQTDETPDETQWVSTYLKLLFCTPLLPMTTCILLTAKVTIMLLSRGRVFPVLLW